MDRATIGHMTEHVVEIVSNISRRNGPEPARARGERSQSRLEESDQFLTTTLEYQQQ